jgi:hypothetical protein
MKENKMENNEQDINNEQQNNASEMLFQQIKAITTFHIIQASLDDLTEMIADLELKAAELAEQAIVIDRLVSLLNKEKEAE